MAQYNNPDPDEDWQSRLFIGDWDKDAEFVTLRHEETFSSEEMFLKNLYELEIAQQERLHRPLSRRERELAVARRTKERFEILYESIWNNDVSNGLRKPMFKPWQDSCPWESTAENSSLSIFMREEEEDKMSHRTTEEKKTLNAAAMVMEGVVTCVAHYVEFSTGAPKSQKYIFLCSAEQAEEIRERMEESRKAHADSDGWMDEDYNYVPALVLNNENKVLLQVAISEVHNDCEVELEGEVCYKFIEMLVPAVTRGQFLQAQREKVAEKLKTNRRHNTRQQLLAQYGLTADDVKAITDGK